MSDPTEWLGEPGWDPVVIVDYNPKWPTRFAHFEDVLRAALGPRALRIDHVGSTAVPGLAAKPVIDIQVSVADVADEHAYRPPMEALGLSLRMREPHHRFFGSPATEERTVHVHVCSAGDKWERDHLLFVAYLREHPTRAAEYGALKRILASRFEADREAYTKAKGDFIAGMLEVATGWAEDMGWRP